MAVRSSQDPHDAPPARREDRHVGPKVTVPVAGPPFPRVRRDKTALDCCGLIGSTLTRTSSTVKAPLRRVLFCRGSAEERSDGRRSEGSREGDGEDGYGARRHRPSDRAAPRRPRHVLPSEASGGRRGVRHQRPHEHGPDPEDHHLGRSARRLCALREPEPLRRGGAPDGEVADRHRRAARPRGHPRRRPASRPAGRRGGRGEVRRRLRGGVRRGRREGRADPGGDGADHRVRRHPPARAEHEPQRVRGVPRRPPRPRHRR